MENTDCTTVRYLHVRRKDVFYIKYLFEGYEGIANTITLDARKTIVKLEIASDFVDLVDKILVELHHEIDFEIIPAADLK
ncbi:MAG: DUF4911 domain-containing protein [Syntrophales bacterium]|nr:DUF4911 domain-containing protein [Syntrophales bacterium]MDY0045179.1 DUF4911 domain-containing protein [Syntrophales bacterium]